MVGRMGGEASGRLSGLVSAAPEGLSQLSISDLAAQSELQHDTFQPRVILL